MFSLRSLCLSVRRITEKVVNEYGPGTNEFNFGDDQDHRPDPGVRSPKSGFTGLSIMLAFGGGLRSLSTSSSVCNCSHSMPGRLTKVVLYERFF